VEPVDSPAVSRPRDGFTQLGLPPVLIAGVVALGYEEPTAIQRETIPPLLSGSDLLGQAATGTGKTAAFALPLIARLMRGEDAPHQVRGLVLVPTRELAMQVAEAVHAYSRGTSLRVLPIYGGQSIRQQLRALERGVDIIVATPGRALDHLRRGTLLLDAVEMVVLDEADEMLDMGFADELDLLLNELPEKHQTALFSATLPKRIAIIAKRHLTNPVRVTIATDAQTTAKTAQIREVAYTVQHKHRIPALARLLDIEQITAAIVFCRTRTDVDALVDTLSAHGYQADALHGGFSQEQRDRVLRKFKDRTTDILIATDVAARGLDIDHVSHVINYQVPSSSDVYVHRIGRTGRAGRTGVAITLCDPKEQRLFRNIELAIKRKITIETIPTVHDLRAHRLEQLQRTLEGVLAAGNLERERRIIEQLATEHDAIDIAAAALRMLDHADERLSETGEDLSEASAPPKRAKGAARSARTLTAPVTLFVSAGRRDRIGPGDLVGAIANTAEIDSQVIGAITIADRHALVEVESNMADRIVAAMRQATIRGKRITIRRERTADNAMTFS